MVTSVVSFAACALILVSSVTQAQLLNGTNLPRVRIDDTVNRVQRQIDSNLQRELSLIDSIDTISTTAVNAVSQLPAQLPILNEAGETALVEVATENGWRALQREWVLYAQDRHLSALRGIGVYIVSHKTLDALDVNFMRVRVPEALDSTEVFAQALAQIDPSIVLERNFVYSAQTQVNSTAAKHETSVTPLYLGQGRIGMIDTAVEASHPAITNGRIVQRRFVDDALPEPRAHGTAVAGRLFGDYGYAPHAQLYSASVFYKRDAYQEGAATHSLVQALDWLLQEKVAVINMSLAGPPNALLEFGLNRAAAKGTLVVAAVGNEGPASPPLFPAAYPSVIGVTAVDDNAQVYRWAVQGEHVEIAAQGVGVRTARIGEEYGYESGTSMAAPMVTAYLARLHYEQHLSSNEARQHLAKAAIDKGEKGRDKVFGLGVLIDPEHDAQDQ